MGRFLVELSHFSTQGLDPAITPERVRMDQCSFCSNSMGVNFFIIIVGDGEGDLEFHSFGSYRELNH